MGSHEEATSVILQLPASFVVIHGNTRVLGGMEVVWRLIVPELLFIWKYYAVKIVDPSRELFAKGTCFRKILPLELNTGLFY